MSGGDWDLCRVVSITIALDNLTLEYPLTTPTDDASALFDVQSFLWCQRFQWPIPPVLEDAWNRFHQRYFRVIYAAAIAYAHGRYPKEQWDDLYQEVWLEVIAHLQKLRRVRLRKGIAQWLAGLTYRKLHRLALKGRTRKVSKLTDSAESWLLAKEPDPEESLLSQESHCRLSEVLAAFRSKVSQDTYEIFYHRFLGSRSAKEVGIAYHLAPTAVHARCSRAKQALQEVARRLLNRDDEQFCLCNHTSIDLQTWHK